jgi:outer membrane protein assembly factor BamB
LQHSSLNSAEARLNQQNIAGLQPAWTLSVGAALAAGVTVSNGVLYFGDWAGNFRAVDAKTGNILWKASLGRATFIDFHLHFLKHWPFLSR